MTAAITLRKVGEGNYTACAHNANGAVRYIEDDAAHKQMMELSNDLSAARREIARLYEALNLAVDMLMKYEPPDSRAVSDEAVSLASVASRVDNDECWEIIRAALGDSQ